MAVLLGRCCSVSFAHLVLEAQQQNPNSLVKLWQAVEEDGCQDDDTCGSKVVPEADAVRTTPHFWYPLWESSRRKMRRLYCFAGPALATRSPCPGWSRLLKHALRAGRLAPQLARRSCVWAREKEFHPSDALQAGACYQPAEAGSEDMAGRLPGPFQAHEGARALVRLLRPVD